MIFITRLISYSDYNSFSGCDVVVSAQMAPINEGDAMKTHVLGSLQTISYSTHQDRAPVRSIGNINAIDYVQGQRTIAGTMVFAMFHEHWMTPLLEELADHVSNTDIWSDELPALNLTISMANEYGYKSNMVLYGVKFIDDGGVVSINDLFTENTLQYVATGIQPLKTSGQYEHSYHSKIEPFKISSVEEQRRESWPWTGVEVYEKEWVNPREIKVDNSNTSAVFHPFTFHVVIDPPLTANDLTFDGDDNIEHRTYAVYITPEPDTERDPFVNIFLKDTDDKTNNTITDKITMEKVPNKDVWYTEVPRGKYDIIIEADEDIHHYIWTLVVDADNVQNNVTITTDFDAEVIPRSVTIHPVVCGVTDTSVTTITNTFFDQVKVTKLRDSESDGEFNEVETDDVKIYDIATDTSIGRSYNKEVLIESLLPDTKYSVKSVDSSTNESSEAVVVKTLPNDNSLQDRLNVFIQTNADVLLNKNLAAVDCETKYEYCNLLDAIVNLSDFSIEPELSLYACVLQNKINNTYNDSGISISHKNYIDNILSNQYNIDESSEFYTIFKKTLTKNYHVLKKEAVWKRSW